MSDTPRTDAEVAGISWFVTDSDNRAYCATDYECLADFARQLERELNEAWAMLRQPETERVLKLERENADLVEALEMVLAIMCDKEICGHFLPREIREVVEPALAKVKERT